MSIISLNRRLTIFPKLLFTFLLAIVPLLVVSLQMNRMGEESVRRELLASMESRVHFNIRSLDAELARLIRLQKQYMIDQDLSRLSTIWALILPGAVPVFNVILLLNFFRNLPKELEESAFIDGAGHWLSLWRIYAPLSLPALATITLFTVVSHWNAWFDGLILMKTPDNYPLSTYLQTILVNVDLTSVTGDDLESIRQVSERTAKAAQIFLGALPILLVYPFLQRFFIKGIVLGSVKE